MRYQAPCRRAFLKRLGTVAAGGVGLSGVTTAKRGGAGRGRLGGGSPLAGITAWGGSVTLGEGEVSTFASVTPSGEPKQVGVHFSEGALRGLPYADAFEAGDVEGGVKAHGFWSLPFDLDLPESVPAPFEYAGVGWNPQGHTPKAVYDRPHFDVHFYFDSRETVGSIGVNPDTGEPYVIDSGDVETGQIPEGYRLIEGGVVVPNMGAHLAPEDAPEFDGAEWLDTLIWGVADGDADDAYELNFIEPMITVDYLESHLDGVRKDPIAQPEVYPQEGHYPTTYTTRALGDGGYAVVLEDFEAADVVV